MADTQNGRHEKIAPNQKTLQTVQKLSAKLAMFHISWPLGVTVPKPLHTFLRHTRKVLSIKNLLITFCQHFRWSEPIFWWKSDKLSWISLKNSFFEQFKMTGTSSWQKMLSNHLKLWIRGKALTVQKLRVKIWTVGGAWVEFEGLNLRLQNRSG